MLMMVLLLNSRSTINLFFFLFRAHISVYDTFNFLANGRLALYTSDALYKNHFTKTFNVCVKSKHQLIKK